MKNKVNKFTTVTELPPEAVTVAQFSRAWNNGSGCNPAYIYELIKKGKNTFQIVEFRGINFIIP